MLHLWVSRLDHFIRINNKPFVIARSAEKIPRELLLRLFKLKLIIFFTCSLFFCFPALAQTLFSDSSNPPPGFESLSQNQHLRVSVLFMQQHIGFFHIELQQGRLKFNSPQHLLSQLTNTKNTKNLFHLLSQPLSLNIECYKVGIAEPPSYCETLKKQPVYIIYHPKQETVYLYLSPSYFKKPKEEHVIDFIPHSTSGWSYINKLGAAASFTDTNNALFSPRIYSVTPNYYNLYSNNILAYGNSSLISNISQNNGINNGQFFQIQNLYAQHIERDKIYTTGYMMSSSSPFFQTQTIVGAGIKTTLETVKNAEDIMATPLVIFIPQASQVNIFKNEQLISSQYLEAGYQRINTSSFPEGGYELTIKIGSNQILHRFFNKGFSLPPKHAPQFYVVGGYLTNGMILNDNAYHFLPRVLNIPLLQTGVNKRISERMALSSDALLSSHQGLVDFGPTIFLGNSFIKTAGLITTKNNYGIYTMLNIQKNRFNINLIATKIFYKNRNPTYFFLNNLIDNDSVSISYRLSESDLLGIQANYNKSLAQPASYNAGTFYQRQIGNYQGMGFFFNAAYNKAIFVGDTYSLSLTVNFTRGHLAGTESISWQNQFHNSPQNSVASPISLQGSTVYSQQNEQQLGYTFNEIHTFSPTISSIAGMYNYTAQQAFAATYANYNHIKNGGYSIGYGGNLETELAVNQSGARLNGIKRENTSGIIVRVDVGKTEERTAKFALVDSNYYKVAVFPPNKKVFISLPGFTDQNYTLVNLSKVDYFIKEPMRHVTLYPGNIGYYSWLAEKRIIVIGRVLTKNQKRPLANTWIHAGKNGIFSDEEGNFQLELAQQTTVLTAGDFCQIKLPKLNIDKAYLYMGDVSCS